MSEHSFVYSEKPIRIERGEGPYLYDADGREYLDFGANYACTPLGHDHPAVNGALHDQVDELVFTQASYPVAQRDRAYDVLADVAPDGLENVWLCNSGTEANEAAIKFARSATDGEGVVAAKRAFHGRTMGSLAMTWRSEYREPFEPVMPGGEFVDWGDPEDLAAAVDDDTAAVFLEPVQGEGGIHAAATEYLQAAREITEDHGAALVFDEVQCGLGRTGHMWASQAAGVTPDALTAAKGLGNGVPVGTTLCADWLAEGAGPHGSTFSGGPVVSAAVEATVSTIRDEALPAHAAEVGEHLSEAIREAAGEDLRAVRGEGLMIGVQVKRGANRMAKQLAVEHGVLVLTSGRTVLRLLPPLTVEREHCDAVAAAIGEVVG